MKLSCLNVSLYLCFISKVLKFTLKYLDISLSIQFVIQRCAPVTIIWLLFMNDLEP